MPLQHLSQPVAPKLVEAWEDYSRPSGPNAWPGFLLVTDISDGDGGTGDYLDSLLAATTRLETEVDGLDRDERQVVCAALFQQDMALAVHELALATDGADSRATLAAWREARVTSGRVLGGQVVPVETRPEVEALATQVADGVDRVLDAVADVAGDVMTQLGIGKLSELLTKVATVVKLPSAGLLAGRAKAALERALKWLFKIVGLGSDAVKAVVGWVVKQVEGLDAKADSIARWALAELVTEKEMVEQLQAAVRTSQADPDALATAGQQIETEAERVERIGGLLKKGLKVLPVLAFAGGAWAAIFGGAAVGVALALGADALDWHDGLLESLPLLGRPGIADAVAAVA